MTQTFKVLAAALAATVLAGVLGGCEKPTQVMTADPQRSAVDARWTLLTAADDNDPFTRVRAIEALAGTMGQAEGRRYVQALGDEQPVVRFAAAMAIGDTRYTPALGHIEDLAVNEPDRRVFVAVIYALYRLNNCKYTPEVLKYTGQLGSLLFDREKEVRGATALVMGKMGDPAAIAPLRSLSIDEQEPMVQLQVKESLALLGHEPSIIGLESDTKSTFTDVRLFAVNAITHVHPRNGGQILGALLESRQPVQVHLAAAGGLAEFGEVDPAGYDLCVATLQDPYVVLRKAYGDEARIDPNTIPSHQSLAANSLGQMRNPAAVDVLVPAMKGADGLVRVSAARAILKLLPVAAPMGHQTASPPDPRPAIGPPPTPTTQPAATEPPATEPAEDDPPMARPRLTTAGAKD